MLTGKDIEEGGVFSPSDLLALTGQRGPGASNDTQRAQKIPKMAEGISRNLCHIVDCGTNLTLLREYHQRFKLCDEHLKVNQLYIS